MNEEPSKRYNAPGGSTGTIVKFVLKCKIYALYIQVTIELY